MAKQQVRRKSIRWQIAVTVLTTLALGMLALNFIPAENKLAHEVPHTYGISDPQFRREMGVLLGPAILPGNQITDLENGDEIFPAMLAAIRGARKSITFETYIYWSGEIGKEFSAALSERAKAGVPVTVTIDWVGGSDMDKATVEQMRKSGVHVESYRPLRWYNFERLNYRTHRKLLVVDGTIAFTGGVGIGDPWQGHAQDPEHWRDIHFRIEGPVVAQMQSAFNDNWVKSVGSIVNGAAYFPKLEPAGTMDANLFMSSPAGGSESMHLMYLMIIAAAEHTIDLEAAYFIPDELISNALLAARVRGVRVRILMPGPHTDSRMARRTSRASWGPFLAEGVEMYEYQPTMMHNKLLIADGQLVSLGSTNFDLRSFQINDEASLNVYDPTFAQHMTTVFENDLTLAQRYTLETWQQRPWSERIAEWFTRPIRTQL